MIQNIKKAKSTTRLSSLSFPPSPHPYHENKQTNKQVFALVIYRVGFKLQNGFHSSRARGVGKTLAVKEDRGCCQISHVS